MLLAPERRTALLDWAARAGAMVLEEDCDGEFRYGGMEAPPLMSLDQADRVIHVGCFSAALGPWLTLGYMVVPRPLIIPALAVRRLIDGGTSWLEHAALAEFLESGAYARHVHRLRKAYLARREALTGALRQHFGAGTALWGGGAGLHLAWHVPPALGSGGDDRRTGAPLRTGGGGGGACADPGGAAGLRRRVGAADRGRRPAARRAASGERGADRGVVGFGR